MACTFANDAYLVAAFPAVVVTVPERYVVAVLAAQAGEYSVTLQGAPFPYEAAADATTAEVAAGLLLALGGQMLAAVAPAGASAFTVDALGPATLDLAATGPADDTIEATLVSGGDSNEAFRLFWLERAKCGLPPCCVVTCAEDYTLMHAALAAHYIFVFGNLGKTGQSAVNYERMRLGPAELSAAANAWAAGNPADADLAKTDPGKLYLALRARYVFGVVTSCGPRWAAGMPVWW